MKYRIIKKVIANTDTYTAWEPYTMPKTNQRQGSHTRTRIIDGKLFGFIGTRTNGQDYHEQLDEAHLLINAHLGI